MPLSIHIDENTQKEIMNNIKGAAAKIIYRIKTQIDRKRIVIIVIVHIKASLYLFLLSIINVSKRRGTTKKKAGSNKNRSLCMYAYTPLTLIFNILQEYHPRAILHRSEQVCCRH